MYPPNFDRVGVTVSYPSEEPKSRQVPPVGIVIEQLEKELHHLREAVGQLNQRLSVVMRPLPETGSAVPDCRSGASPLVYQIESLTQLTRNTSSNLFAMLDCLEL
jgi:hypothetical protein